MCVLRYNQSKRIKLGPIKNRNEFIKRDWKGISTKGFNDLKNQKGFNNPLLRIKISKIMWMNKILLYFGSDLAAWPSGKAGDCKSFIPSSNLGAA